MANSTNFDDLPAEMICEIFGYLNINDIISCKQVCKRFYEIVGGLRIRWLSVHHPKEYGFSSECCHPHLFKAQIGQPILSRLHSLTITHSFDLDLNILNQLGELVQLRIGYLRYDHPELELSLPKLRDLEFFQQTDGEITVDCPNLERLSHFGWDDPDYFEVKRPETIITLQTDFLGENLRPFKNVLYLSSYRDYRILDESTLLALPNLKELRYNGYFGQFGTRYGEEKWSNARARLRNFMERKRALKMFDLKVFFGCVELVDDKPIDEYEFEQYHENIERFYMINLPQMIKNDEFSVNYCRLMDVLGGGELPSDYFEKFSRVTTVKVDERQGQRTDQEHLLWFMKSLKGGLRVLHLEEASVDHRFFDQLSELFASTLEVLDFSKVENIDWKFAEKLTKLERFWVIGEASTLSLQEINYLLNLKAIHNGYISFRFNGFEVVREDEGEYRLNRWGRGIQWIKSKMSIDDLLQFFRKTFEDASKNQKNDSESDSESGS